jgi:hypothetical protein
MDERMKPSRETRSAEREDAAAEHDADRPPTDDEARAAGDRTADPEVSEHYEEMAERGARQQGEGRIS